MGILKLLLTEWKHDWVEEDPSNVAGLKIQAHQLEEISYNLLQYAPNKPIPSFV